jgi:50S ribosomal subunit-associated GTPase HflX
VPTSYFLGAAGVIYVFDLSRPMTFQNIATDLEYLRNLLPYSVIKVVGNKSDLLTPEQLEEVGQKLSIKWDIVTSAKNGDNVEELFLNLATEMI